MASVLKTLTPREETIIRMRFGLYDGSAAHARGSGLDVRAYPRAHPPDRSQGTVQAAPPFALAQAPRLPRLRLARVTVNLSLRIVRTIKRPRRDLRGCGLVVRSSGGVTPAVALY